jgi:hypothetical protein
LWARWGIIENEKGSRTMERHVVSFVAQDENGEEYTIHMYVQQISVSSHDDANATIDGLKRLVTDDGASVNRIRKGEYKLVADEIMLFSDDPNAP